MVNGRHYRHCAPPRGELFGCRHRPFYDICAHIPASSTLHSAYQPRLRVGTRMHAGKRGFLFLIRVYPRASASQPSPFSDNLSNPPIVATLTPTRKLSRSSSMAPVLFQRGSDVGCKLNGGAKPPPSSALHRH